MENTSDYFMPRPLLFCMKSEKSVCYSMPDNIHSLKTSDKVLRYGENNQVEFSEHPTVVQRGNERTINIYAAIPDAA